MGRHQGAEQAAAALVALTFYATIVWAIGYWIVYPGMADAPSAIPGRARLQPRGEVMAKIDQARRQPGRPATARIEKASSDRDRSRTRALNAFALRAAKRPSPINCAPCHGRGAQGFPGYPNLNDDDWLWGGTLEQIQQTIITASASVTTGGACLAMPRSATKILTPEQISDTADYVLSLVEAAPRRRSG